MMLILSMQMFLKHNFLSQCAYFLNSFPCVICQFTVFGGAKCSNILDSSTQWSPESQGLSRLVYVTPSMCIMPLSRHLPGHKRTSGRFLSCAECSPHSYGHAVPSLSLFIFFFYHNHLGLWVIGTIRVINCAFVIKTEDQGGLHYRLNIFRKLYQLVDITNVISSMQHEAEHIVQTGLLWNSNLLKRSQSV